ncbi:MAG TPA: dienelactone hydrolase family protein [Gemmatimonadaceae bacterium]|nr:dienelactone hydrolase family protein [Gemmatimonadaceae bacterium]
MPDKSHIQVSRTARYFTLGDKTSAVTEVWFACHGYGQLASDFVKEFECIDEPGRLIVVPEALSRFYLPEGTGFHGPDARIGATWMTREDRDNEIVDYVNYLDALYEETLQGLDREKIKVTALGFSQGGATVSRWLAAGKSGVSRLILWGSTLASDANLEEMSAVFHKIPLTIVYGKRDQFADEKLIAGYEEKLKKYDIPFDFIAFEGGHRMDRDTLRNIAQLPF